MNPHNAHRTLESRQPWQNFEHESVNTEQGRRFAGYLTLKTNLAHVVDLVKGTGTCRPGHMVPEDTEGSQRSWFNRSWSS